MATDYNRQLYLEGKQLDIAIGAGVGSVDWQFPYPTKLVGVKIFLNNNWKWGDRADFTIHSPVDDSEVGRFATNAYFTDVMGEVTVETSGEGADILPNLKYRVTINLADTTGRKAAVWLIIRK